VRDGRGCVVFTEHHHWIWSNLISPIPVEIASEADFL
jgi:hypothetical protein